MKIEAHIYMHDSEQLDRIECLLRRLVDEEGDRETAKELTGDVQASTKELKDAMAATQPAP